MGNFDPITINISTADKEDYNEIEKFLLCSKHSFVYYTPTYWKFLKDILPNAKLNVIIAREKEHIVGILPYFIQRNEHYGEIMNSLPFFGGHGGALVHDGSDKVTNALYKKLAGIIKEENFASITIVENPFQPISEIQAELLNCKPIDDRISQITGLAESENPEKELLDKFHQKTRNSIRKGLQLNLRIEEKFDFESLEWLQDIHEKSIKSMGGVFKPLSIFQSLAEKFGLGHKARLMFAYDGDEAVSGILFLTHMQTIEYFTPVVIDKFRDKQALSALVFECMCMFSREGYKRWNWGGTWRSQRGVYRFKTRWGAEEYVYRYFNKVANSALLEAEQSEIRFAFPWFYTYKYDE